MEHQDRLLTLIRVNDEMHGSVLVSLLAESGIKATCTGVYTAGFRAEAPGYVDVVISEKDFTRARKLIEGVELEESVDWSTVDVGEPED